jgi:hypothetical protein
MATVACELSANRVLSSGAPKASLSVGGIAEVGNSLNSARLAVFARDISLTLAGHSADHDVCSPLWQAAHRCSKEYRIQSRDHPIRKYKRKPARTEVGADVV